MPENSRFIERDRRNTQALACSEESALCQRWRILWQTAHCRTAGEVRIFRLPFTHRHINVLGHYFFAMPEAVPHGALRSLRDPATMDELEGL
jgi:hypothetical protein